MRIKLGPVLLTLPLLVAACGPSAPAAFPDKDYQALRASITVPAGFTSASPTGPCSNDPHMQCWTTTALPTEAAHAAVAGLAGFRTTDTSWCSTEHWAQQRKSWGEAHTPCALHGTVRGLKVSVEAIAFPDREASTPGHLVFPPTLVSIVAFP